MGGGKLAWGKFIIDMSIRRMGRPIFYGGKGGEREGGRPAGLDVAQRAIKHCSGTRALRASPSLFRICCSFVRSPLLPFSRDALVAVALRGYGGEVAAVMKAAQPFIEGKDPAANWSPFAAFDFLRGFHVRRPPAFLHLLQRDQVREAGLFTCFPPSASHHISFLGISYNGLFFSPLALLLPEEISHLHENALVTKRGRNGRPN